MNSKFKDDILGLTIKLHKWVKLNIYNEEKELQDGYIKGFAARIFIKTDPS